MHVITGNYIDETLALNNPFSSEVKTAESSISIIGDVMVIFEDYYKNIVDYYSGIFVETLYENQERTEADQNPENIINSLNKLKYLKEQFNIELTKHLSYLPSNVANISKYFETISSHLSDLNYEKISLEFTTDGTFFFNILLNAGLKAHIECYLNANKEDIESGFFNIFKEKKSVLSGYGKLSQIVNEINAYI